MINFRFDIDKMIRWLMPYFLVKPKHLAWLQTLFAPLKTLYADFIGYKALQLKNATINSQKARLETALRDQFEDNSIYIFHPDDYLDQAFIYLQREGATPEFDYLHIEAHVPVDYDATQPEYNTQYDFIVRIPASLAGSTQAIHAFVKKYVFSSITFTIETF
jgi:hypothetical protein